MDQLQSSEGVTVKLVLVSGKSASFLFPSTSTAGEITEAVHVAWPQEWEEEKVDNPTMLKLIYHGRFLHGSVSLQTLGYEPGHVTAMHLVTRESLPQPDSKEKQSNRKQRRCCNCCSLS
ncbi:hypothetical protein PFISCL1PPCAC_10009 [Pristionchus fissidentatus]|uniref:Ubiquitin-like domain-containing protein n=1 Tax=Pristionchus fissidentatus TaxID=1538716 RepID=A0AAV5VG60_9BILA|nr:hypothetical protein PFISCL1PPCAC_10009 [Pristionchus fissidentatus]